MMIQKLKYQNYREVGCPDIIAVIGTTVRALNASYAYRINNAIRHEKFPRHRDYDIGLARTARKIVFSTTVGLIALPTHTPVMSGDATLAGFGRITVK